MSIIKNALIEEIKEKTIISQEYYDIIQTAKTTAKVNLYKKKLAKHNNILADLLISLDKLNQSHYNSEDTNKNGSDNDVECEHTQQSQ